VAKLEDDGGHVLSTACSTVVFGRRWNRVREEEEEALEEGNESTASPAACRREMRPRGGLEGSGGDVAQAASSVAFHRAAWRHALGKKTPVPLWAGWAAVGCLRLGAR
jgi:hypothetical protein